jgi:Family of unknown function (DUF6328)
MATARRSHPPVPRLSDQARRRNESEEQRIDRNLGELLQELRIAIPGIQFIFAFLLIVPFQQGWSEITGFERGVYYGTLLATAASTVLLIAPTARHRMRFRALDKEWVVSSSNRLAIAGLALLAIAMVGTILLISSVVYDSAVAAVATAGIVVAIAWLWFGAPWLRARG